MAKEIKVKIGGRTFSLKGDDEELVKLAAEELDEELKKVSESHSSQSVDTKAILAALNIAEKKYKIEKQKENDESYLVNEIGKMESYINEEVLDKSENGD